MKLAPFSYYHQFSSYVQQWYYYHRTRLALILCSSMNSVDLMHLCQLASFLCSYSSNSSCSFSDYEPADEWTSNEWSWCNRSAKIESLATRKWTYLFGSFGCKVIIIITAYWQFTASLITFEHTELYTRK